MAIRSLNTSHPLYSYLAAAIILDANDTDVVELKTGVTLTKHASVRLPGTSPASDSTPYGRSFEPGGQANDGSVPWNVALASAISVPTNAPMSVFAWHNGYVDTHTGWAAYTRMMADGITVGRHIGPAFQFDPADGRWAPCSTNGALALTTLGPVKTAGDLRPATSIAFTRNASNPLKAWIGGARDANYSGSGMAINTGAHGGPQANSELGKLGGMQTWSRFSWVGFFVFVGYELTDSDVADLHASLGVNAMAMLTAPSDTTPPTLTSPTGTGGALVCSGSVSTDEAGGNLYAVATASATAPTKAQVKAGQDHAGAAALRVVSQAVSATGAQTIASGSITAGTRYWHYMHEDAAANQSSVVSSASFAVSSGAATAVTLTGPSAGDVGVASTNFTVGANGTITGTVTVTPSDSSGGGSFSPSAVAISSGTPTGTFTYTPGSAGVKSISVTNTGGLANPSALSYTATSVPGFDLSSAAYAFKNNTGAVIPSAALTMWAANPSTGALVAQITGYGTNASGIVASKITHASLVVGTQYRVTWEFASGEYGVAKLTAS